MEHDTSVISYTLSKCSKCMKCIHSCPTKCIRMDNERIAISKTSCINCATCIKVCHYQGLQAKGSTIYDIKNYEYSICLVSSALIAHMKTNQEIEALFHSIKQLGFDEVVDLTDVEAYLYEQATKYDDKEMHIASFCPMVNNLIRVKYPILLDKIIKFDYPSEIKAKLLKEKYHDKNVGIFNLCECEAKLPLAKYPYGNAHYNVDHALSIVDIFPLIKNNLKNGHYDIDICLDGLKTTNSYTLESNDKLLSAEGFDSVNNILEMAEFGLLEDYSLLWLYPCFGGCLGGHLMWGNGYLARNNISYIKGNKKPLAVNVDRLINEDIADITSDHRTIKEKLKYFNSVNEQLEKLPGYDCSACGLATCRIMAEEIVKNNRSINDCHILNIQNKR